MTNNPKVTIYKSNSMKDAANFIFRSLKVVDKKQLSVMHTVIVPDRTSLEAERALLAAVGGSINIQVKTFRRLANDILPDYEYLSKQAGIMALTGIIQDKKAEMTCYKRGVETSGFVSDMYDTICMMKYCKIKPQDLMRDDLPKNLHDIAILYQGYVDFTEGRFVDSAEKLNLLCDHMDKSDVVTNGYFYLFDFDNFSSQELSIVEKLMNCSLGVTVACCVDESDGKYLYLNDIFNGVDALCKKNGNVVPRYESGSSYINRFAKQIGENMFRNTTTAPIQSEGFVEMYQGTTRVQEVYALACRVQRYIREGGGRRFRDVYVVTSDITKYTNAITTVFKEFNIPFFCDKQFCLADHPYARYILDYFSVFRNNGRLNSVLAFVKNHLFCGDFGDRLHPDDDVFYFENYCLKYNISYSYERFTLGKNEKYFQNADDFREKFNKLYKSVTVPSKETANGYVKIIRQLIAESNLDGKAVDYSAQQEKHGLSYESKITAQAAQKFEDVLRQVEVTLGERVFKLDDFLKLLNVAVSAVNISVIPVKNDCVVFANMAKARKHDIKFLALLGANQGAMPIVKSDCKLLSDKSIRTLNEKNLPVTPTVMTENRRERFSLFQLLLEPSEKLYVSYAATDGTAALLPSPFVGELSRLFADGNRPLVAKAETDEEVYTRAQAVAKVVLNSRRETDSQMIKMPAYDLLKSELGEEAQRYAYTQDGSVRVQNGKDFYLYNSEMSVSRITDFYKCPYKYFFEYGLYIRPRTVAELNAADLGNILHDVLDNYVKEMDANETDEQTRINAEKCFTNAVSDDYYRGICNDKQQRGTLAMLKREAKRMCLEVKRQLKNSLFQNVKTEMEFGKRTGDAVEVDYGSGKLLLKGKVDRLDADGNNFIVIDYKSGASAADYNETYLYCGQKLQLLVYVQAVIKVFSDKGFVPVGFYYFNMHDKFLTSGKRDYFYGGRTLDDKEVVMRLDTAAAETGKSEKLGISYNKTDGLPSKTSQDKMLSAQQIQNQVDYALEMVRRAAQKMQEGYADITPYKGTCDYCDFRPICDFNDTLTYQPREVKQTIDKDTIDKVVK